MRVSSFLWGSLVGAGAVIYLSRMKNNGMMLSMSQIGDSMNRMVGAVKERAKTKTSSSTSSNVEEVIHDDPELEKTFNTIMQDNQQPHEQFQTQ